MAAASKEGFGTPHGRAVALLNMENVAKLKEQKELFRDGAWEVWNGTSDQDEVVHLVQAWDRELDAQHLRMSSRFMRPFIKLAHMKRGSTEYDSSSVLHPDESLFILKSKAGIGGIAFVDYSQGYEVSGFLIKPEARGASLHTLPSFFKLLRDDMRRRRKTSVTFLVPSDDERLNNFHRRIVKSRQFGSGGEGYNDYILTLAEIEERLQGIEKKAA